MKSSIKRIIVQEEYRVQHTAKLFGVHFPCRLEPYIFELTRNIAPSHQGGYWQFYSLSNGGFYIAPHTENEYEIICVNGFEGQLSADALGIASSLYAYSHLSFCQHKEFAEMCSKQYHLLRSFMLEHQEVKVILRAID